MIQQSAVSEPIDQDEDAAPDVAVPSIVDSIVLAKPPVVVNEAQRATDELRLVQIDLDITEHESLQQDLIAALTDLRNERDRLIQRGLAARPKVTAAAAYKAVVERGQADRLQRALDVQAYQRATGMSGPPSVQCPAEQRLANRPRTC